MMFSKLSSYLRQFKATRDYLALPSEHKNITFYAEDISTKMYFGRMIEILSEEMQQPIAYISSDPKDPILSSKNPLIRSFYIEAEVFRIFLFQNLNCKLMIMTMPDLGTFHLKRSKVHAVKYVYIFHSIVSTHMIYRKGAFDHFDVIFTVGPHHEKELRKQEKVYNLKPKTIFPFGYPRLDQLIRDYEVQTQINSRVHVLLAPSWGPNGILENYGEEICEILLDEGYQLTVRPHPHMLKKTPHVAKILLDKFGDRPGFTLENTITTKASFDASDILICDWSGVSLEYSFVYKKPIVFLDVARKVNNPEYEKIDLVPLEVSIREKIGRIVKVEQLRDITRCINDLLEAQAKNKEQINTILHETVYNVGISELIGAKEVYRLAHYENG